MKGASNNSDGSDTSLLCICFLDIHLLVLFCFFRVAFCSSSGKVARPRDCTMCRECIREPGWSDKVSLTRIADHFIFGIESVGMLPPKVGSAASAKWRTLSVFGLEADRSRKAPLVGNWLEGIGN